MSEDDGSQEAARHPIWETLEFERAKTTYEEAKLELCELRVALSRWELEVLKLRLELARLGDTSR